MINKVAYVMEKLKHLGKLHKGLCYWESKILEEIMSDHANRKKKNPSCLIAVTLDTDIMHSMAHTAFQEFILKVWL